MSTVQRPVSPNRVIDDALYHALMDTVGQELAFAACETVWDVLFRHGVLVGPSVTRERELVIPLDGHPHA